MFLGPIIHKANGKIVKLDTFIFFKFIQCKWRHNLDCESVAMKM